MVFLLVEKIYLKDIGIYVALPLVYWSRKVLVQKMYIQTFSEQHKLDFSSKLPTNFLKMAYTQLSVTVT